MDLTIIVESNIPFVRGLLEPHAHVIYLRPEEITPDAMRHADALITRTRTRCDATLLAESRCAIISSATIGLDHIDTDYCSQRGIDVANAPGCNAPAVAQYVLSSIIAAYGTDLHGHTIGIVGVGHVGRIVDRWARQLGMTTMPCDPPRAEAEGPDGFFNLDDIAANADIITFHTPYTRQGPYATHHMCDSTFLSKLMRRPMIINSARGPITDTQAINRAIGTGCISHTVIDCWENEPDIDRTLLQNSFIATPHIAGYSRSGKIRATRMAVEAVARKFGFPVPQMAEQTAPGAAETVTASDIARSYSPLSDTAALRANPNAFEALRNNYRLRPEVMEI